MIYSTAAHFTGLTSNRADITVQLPWVYIVVAFHDKLLYIGETFDEAGLIIRLSTHFGRLTESTFKKAASRLGILNPSPPFLILAARLPIGESAHVTDASSKTVRLIYEGELHRIFAKEFAANSSWTLISSFSSTSKQIPASINHACQSIYKSFITSKEFLQPLSKKVPFQLVILDYKLANEEEEELEIDKILERIEIQLFTWIINSLKKEFPNNPDEWWRKGISLNIRTECQKRKEQEAISGMQPEAYLNLIDFQDIFKKNWKLFGDTLEKISAKQGKDKSTLWLGELNDIRKVWAHPIKKKYIPIQPKQITEARNILKKLEEFLPEYEVD